MSRIEIEILSSRGKLTDPITGTPEDEFLILDTDIPVGIGREKAIQSLKYHCGSDRK